MSSRKWIVVSLFLLLAFIFLINCQTEVSGNKDQGPETLKTEDAVNLSGSKGEIYSSFAEQAWSRFINLNEPITPNSNNYVTKWLYFPTSHQLFGRNKTEGTSSDGAPNQQGLVIPNYIQANDSSARSQNSPLIDLDNNYAWAELRYNFVFRDYIFQNRLDDIEAIRMAFVDGNGPAMNAIKWLPGEHTFPPDVSKKVKVAKIEFPLGSEMIKPAWKILSQRDNPDEFFLIQPSPELIYENYNYRLLKNALMERGLVDGNCKLLPAVQLLDEKDLDKYNENPPNVEEQVFQPGEVKFGLVGFHLVWKFTGQENWIWATFEHIKNGPPEGDTEAYKKKWTFFDDVDGSKPHNAWPNPTSGLKNSIPANQITDAILHKFQWFDPNVRNQTPVQVTQMNPTSAIIKAVNEKYQQQYSQSIWANYRLTDVQWTSTLDTMINGKRVQRAEPKYVANTAIETYIQSTSSCMGCHALVSDANKDKVDDYEYLVTSPESYHFTIPLMTSPVQNSVLVGDFSYGLYEMAGIDITSRQITPDPPTNPVNPPRGCIEE